MVKYVEENSPYVGQGRKVTIGLGETVGGLKEFAREELRQEGITDDVELIEVMKLSHGYVHLLRSLDSIPDEETLEKAGIKHLCCLLALPRSSIEPAFKYIGQECEPIVVKLRLGKTDYEVPVNKGWTLARARTAAAGRMGRTEEEVTFNVHSSKSELQPLTSWDSPLSDLKWYHTMSLICLEPQSVPAPQSPTPSTAPSLPSSQVSVLVYDEEDQEKVVQHYITLSWKLSALITDLQKLFAIALPIECRLKRLVDSYYFTSEDLHRRVADLGFEDGGVRLCLERGSAPDPGQIVVKTLFNNQDTDIFVSSKATVGDLYVSIQKNEDWGGVEY